MKFSMIFLSRCALQKYHQAGWPLAAMFTFASYSSIFLGVFLAQEILQWANSYSHVQNRAVCLLNANEQ
jgi:hypothetical protein